MLCLMLAEEENPFAFVVLWDLKLLTTIIIMLENRAFHDTKPRVTNPS